MTYKAYEILVLFHTLMLIFLRKEKTIYNETYSNFQNFRFLY